jgi:hypothetical protein
MTEHEALNNLVAAIVRCMCVDIWNDDYYKELEKATHAAQKVLISNIGGSDGIQQSRPRLRNRRFGRKRPNNLKGRCRGINYWLRILNSYGCYKLRTPAGQRAFAEFRKTGNGRKFTETLAGL